MIRQLLLKKTDFSFDARQKEIFEGCMLGDGGLVWQNNNCYFRNTDTFEEYLVWLQKQLGVKDISRVAPKYNSDFNDIVDGHVLSTRVIPSIREEHKRWYPYATRHGTHQNRNYKVVPKNIELTPIKMLFWYIGDGHYLKYDGAAVFCNSFSFDDWLVLSKKVCKVLDVDSGVSINKCGKNYVGRQRYHFRLYESVTRKFFDMIDDLGFNIPKCYRYKFGRL